MGEHGTFSYNSSPCSYKSTILSRPLVQTCRDRLTSLCATPSFHQLLSATHCIGRTDILGGSSARFIRCSRIRSIRPTEVRCGPSPSLRLHTRSSSSATAHQAANSSRQSILQLTWAYQPPLLLARRCAMFGKVSTWQRLGLTGGTRRQGSRATTPRCLSSPGSERGGTDSDMIQIISVFEYMSRAWSLFRLAASISFSNNAA